MLKRATVLVSLSIVFVLVSRVGGQGEPAGGDPTEGAQYIGASACKKCHLGEHKSYMKMKHAKAWEGLPEKYRAADQKDEGGRECMSCHVTGWGEGARGGFVDAKTSEHLLGVQCEACHGPGSKHREAGQKVLDEKRKTFNEGEKRFIVKRTTNCANCHNPHITHEKYKEGAGG